MTVKAWSVKKSLVVCAALLLTISARAQGWGEGHRGEKGTENVRAHEDRSDDKAIDETKDRKDSPKAEKRVKSARVQKANRSGYPRGNTGSQQPAARVNGRAVSPRTNRSNVQTGAPRTPQNAGRQRPSGQVAPGVRRTNAVHPAMIRNRNEILATHRDHSVIRLPNEGPNHQAFHARILASAPRAEHMSPMRNAMVLNHVMNYNRSEVVRNHYYWHEDGGNSYCHYYDPWGYHWYGWYAGSDFFWTRYYSGRWWWYDSAFDRWCFWHDNGWWWQDSAQGAMYAYANNTYAPVEETAAVAPVAAAPSDSANHTEFWDAADNRVVKVFGQDAFLYDTTNPPTFDPKFLASNVSDVKFSKANSGRPLQVMVTLADGSFLLFDGSGLPYSQGAGQ